MNLIFCVLWCGLWFGALADKGSFLKLVGVGRPNSVATARSLIIEDKWFKQKVDHFNPSDTRTWKQRYHMNLQHYKHGGPIFLSIGGEEEITHNWMTSGAWIEYAKKLNAMCFQLEHRYYGRSHPTDNLKTKNLKYLTVEQVLADLETFISTISNDNEETLRNAKWIVFGGSYSGSLAAWLRMKYPHLVYAAVSSSSPLMAKIDYKDFYMAIQNTISNYNPKCASNIIEATSTISDLLETSYGAKYVDKKFKTCSDMNIKNKKDKTVFFNNLALPVALIIQYNNDNKKKNKLALSLVKLCDMMLDKSLGNPLERYVAVHKQLRSVNNQICTSINYQDAISALKETSWNAENVKSGSRQWLYLICTQIGNFVTSNNRNDLFGNSIPLDYYTGMCRDVFGKSFNANSLNAAVRKTNMIHHDLKKKTSRIIYLHGTIDAWSTLGLIQPMTKHSVSIVIEGGSHCSDLYPSRSSDSPQLKKARKTVEFYLKKWLS
ncbi:putative serine protease K12H4.7 [Acyrthosiphon pisum]|uniref:Serine protease K12H4.7 n=1 Tax=Acyrthosiphon pisum TaxID=7029 RepID=A0A8R1W327_ACYPI|nr:putative serine protease K12H4.7 [Acyrthosiphon pisum]|eukprot:XP_001947565.2 PREDICTED: putative serine protease K12H4.7 [Acyrthosiphon pisum]